MTFFQDKIRAGIESATKALDNAAEIDRVFLNLENELEEMGIPAKIAFEDITILHQVNIPMGAPKYARKRLLLSGPGESFQLGYFARSESGYPCAIIVGNDVISANDRISLENILGDLFATTRVGRMLHTISASKASENLGSSSIGLGDEDDLSDPASM